MVRLVRLALHVTLLDLFAVIFEAYLLNFSSIEIWRYMVCKAFQENSSNGRVVISRSYIESNGSQNDTEIR